MDAAAFLRSVESLEHDLLGSFAGLQGHTLGDGPAAGLRPASPAGRRGQPSGNLGTVDQFFLCLPARREAFAERLHGGGPQSLRPEFAEERRRPVDLRAGGQPVDQEPEAHGPGICLRQFAQCGGVILHPAAERPVLHGQLQTRRAGGGRHIGTHARGQLALDGGDLFPHVRLRLFLADDALELGGRQGFLRAGKLRRRFAPALTPAALLDAERRHAHAPAAGRHDEVRAEGAVLPPALDHVTGLQEQVEVSEVLDLQLVDVARLVKLGTAVGEALAEHQELPGWGGREGFAARLGRSEQTNGQVGEDGGIVQERVGRRHGMIFRSSSMSQEP